MSANIIAGKIFAENIIARVCQHVDRLKRAHDITPCLAVILVGDDPASQVYVRNKAEKTREAGIISVEHRLPSDTPQADVLALIDTLNQDPAIHGILVQLPLPSQLDSHHILNHVAQEKDVDGFHVINTGLLAMGKPAIAPCTPLGCVLLLRHYLGDLAGLHAVVVGRSNIVGKPMAQLLLGENCTVTIGHSHTKNLPSLCRQADIIVAAVGRPKMIKQDWIKPGATVIDVGINRITAEDGKPRLVGDVDFAAIREIAGAITPVPGGVGPLTIACLLANTVTACHLRLGLPPPQDLIV